MSLECLKILIITIPTILASIFEIICLIMRFTCLSKNCRMCYNLLYKFKMNFSNRIPLLLANCSVTSATSSLLCTVSCFIWKCIDVLMPPTM
ncbi:hypothetical protein JOM56_002581, partial [Amanita muscaria]